MRHTWYVLGGEVSRRRSRTTRGFGCATCSPYEGPGLADWVGTARRGRPGRSVDAPICARVVACSASRRGPGAAALDGPICPTSKGSGISDNRDGPDRIEPTAGPIGISRTSYCDELARNGREDAALVAAGGGRSSASEVYGRGGSSVVSERNGSAAAGGAPGIRAGRRFARTGSRSLDAFLSTGRSCRSLRGTS